MYGHNPFGVWLAMGASISTAWKSFHLSAVSLNGNARNAAREGERTREPDFLCVFRLAGTLALPALEAAIILIFSGCATPQAKPSIRPLAGAHHWPLDAPSIKTLSRFGEPRGHKKRHQGVDLAVDKGTPVLAAADGRVTLSGRVREYGRCIILRHSGATETLYAHLRKSKVHEGENVAAGQIIGYSGASGNATAPHLHYEVRKDGRPVDPEQNMP